MSLQRIEFLQQFAGVPSYDAERFRLLRSMDETAPVNQADFNARNIAQDLSIQSKGEALIGLARKNIYLGGALGNDENNGETDLTPFATLSALLRSHDFSQDAVITLQGDVVLDEVISLPNKQLAVDFEGGADRYSLTFQGAARVVTRGNTVMNFVRTNLMNDKNEAQACFSILGGGAFTTNVCEIDMTQSAIDAGSFAFFHTSVFTNIYRYNTIVSDRAEGRIVRDLLPADISSRAALSET